MKNVALTREIFFLTLEHKNRIFSPPGNILYLYIYGLLGFPASGALPMRMYRYTAPFNLRVGGKHGRTKTMSKYKSAQRHKAERQERQD